MNFVLKTDKNAVINTGRVRLYIHNGPKLALENPNGRYKKISPINIYQPVGYCNWFMRQMEDDQEKQTEGLLHEKGEKEKSIEDSKQN